MAVSNAQKLAIKKYREKNIEIISFETKKGKREVYKTAAAKLGLGQMEMIRRAIEEYIQNHGGEDFTPKPELTAEQRRLVEEFNQLTPETQKALVKLVRTFNQSKGGGDND